MRGSGAKGEERGGEEEDERVEIDREVAEPERQREREKAAEGGRGEIRA